MAWKKAGDMDLRSNGQMGRTEECDSWSSASRAGMHALESQIHHFQVRDFGKVKWPL
jgi:hypothetical protein